MRKTDPRTSRPLKFRAWGGKRMFPVEGMSSAAVWGRCEDNGCPEDHSICDDIVCPPKAVTLMQYTGLKDMNGVEIYEGDIITVSLSMPAGDQANPADWVVKYNHAAFWRYDWRGEKYSAWALADQMEVIGNSHQNPELLQI